MKISREFAQKYILFIMVASVFIHISTSFMTIYALFYSGWDDVEEAGVFMKNFAGSKDEFMMVSSIVRLLLVIYFYAVYLTISLPIFDIRNGLFRLVIMAAAGVFFILMILNLVNDASVILSHI